MFEPPHGLASHVWNGCSAALLLLTMGLSACAASSQRETKPAATPAVVKAPDSPLQPNAAPLMPPAPRATGKTDVFTVAVNNVAVADVLFVLARDAKLSLDISPRVVGAVTLIAVDQTLHQILSRIAEQVDMRYEFKDSTIVVRPDTPFERQYKIDYVNIERESKSASNIATQIQASSGAAVGTSGGGESSNNNSTSELSGVSRNRFWYSLVANVKALVGDATVQASGQGAAAASAVAPLPVASAPIPIPIPVPAPASPTAGAAPAEFIAAVAFKEPTLVIANAETGLLVVRATARQQDRVQEFLDVVLRSARRQVLIEATIAEVQLSDQYQQGINWQKFGNGSLSITQQPQGPAPLPGGSIPGSGPGGITFPPSSTPLPTPALAVLQFISSNPTSFLGNLSVAVSLLESFGKVKVLSSPKLSVLNNQTAFLKVVDNRIYFNIGVQITPGTLGVPPIVTYTSTPATVPVGFVMSVTPSIDESGMVMMDVRPTISRIIDYVNDPNPALAQARVVSQIPEIQTREIESLLRVKSGEIAVMGGLMQDATNNASDEVPGLGRIPWLGNLFKYKNDNHTKSELVIFLRPVVIRDASLEGDYREFKAAALRDGVLPGGPAAAPMAEAR
ncbi:MAG: biosis protein MshL [Gammaproteobacteria bacterium]|jgi:general secretion pathway protein D|nr:biosis protein MshL [Gammaproteobacteria bacterium]